jgi:hypothetical protein
MADLMDLARAAARSLHPEQPEDEDYTPEDLGEMDLRLHELARLEGWTADELADKLDQRRRMAAVNVQPALHLLRAGAKAARDTKAEKPTKRVPVVLCVIKGGKA